MARPGSSRLACFCAIIELAAAAQRGTACRPGYHYCEKSTSPSRPDLHESAKNGQAFCDSDGDCQGDLWCPDESRRAANTCATRPVLAEVFDDSTSPSGGQPQSSGLYQAGCQLLRGSAPHGSWEGCEWIRSNSNTNGEYRIGNGFTPKECVVAAKLRGCQVANINYDGGDPGACYCQWVPKVSCQPDEGWASCVLVPERSEFRLFDSPKSYDDARDSCQSHGGDLASVHSFAENAEAFQISGGRSVWLGLTDRALEGSWLWSDGTPMDFTYWNVADNHGGNEDCAGFWEGRARLDDQDPAGRWDDMYGTESCAAKLPYICRIPPRLPFRRASRRILRRL